ncbi:hypothetical protein ACNOYE_34295 [Nannocystaceae bacterium ST9]
MAIHTIRTTCLLALGLGLGCTSDDAGSDEVEGTGTDGAEAGTDETQGTGDTGDESSGTDTGDDPNAACASTWDVVEKKANGQVHAAYDVAIAADGNFVAVGKLENADDDAWIGMFGPAGEPIWDEVVDSGSGKDYAASVTFDASGDVVVVGSLANTNKDLWIEKRSAAAGAIAWTVIEPSEFDGDNLPGAIGLAPDGGLIVAATIRAGDQDSDLALRKLSTADGAQVWTTSFSGAADPNGYSIDQARALAVAADGSIYVGIEQGVDAGTKEGALLKYGPDGGAEQWRLAPKDDGSEHLQEVVAVAAGPEGEAYFVVYEPEVWSLYRASSAGSVEWELTQDDFMFSPTSAWQISDLAISAAGTLTIGGRLIDEEVGQSISWSEAWLADIRLDGVGECISSHTWKNTHIIPASTYAYAFAEGPDGVIAVGEVVDGPENYLWFGGFE